MRVPTFLKGAVAGGVGAATVLVATAAFAGTGVGGIFNLGQANTVNATSTLSGATPGKAQLQVTNTGTTTATTGIGVTTASSKPPFNVSSTQLNARLNSQYVGGYQSNQLGRLGIALQNSLIGVSSTATQATVSITVPKAGFVRLDGTITAYDGFSGSFCSNCAVYVRLHDDATGAESPMAYAQGGAGAHASSMVIPVTWVFAATAGAHTYSLTTAQQAVSGGGFGFYNPVLVAQFVPFGSTGSPTVLSAAAKTASTSARRVSVRR
jgi:hypothetical protein